MVTAQHLRVVDAYLEDLRSAVEAVRANPELAGQGGAATYGMLAHVPLRGMVRKKVLEMYSEQYRAGGGEWTSQPVPPLRGETAPACSTGRCSGTWRGAPGAARAVNRTRGAAFLTRG